MPRTRNTQQLNVDLDDNARDQLNAIKRLTEASYTEVIEAAIAFYARDLQIILETTNPASVNRFTLTLGQRQKLRQLGITIRASARSLDDIGEQT